MDTLPDSCAYFDKHAHSQVIPFGLPRETLGLVIEKVDTSTRLSLWWTAKSFHPFIRLPELTHSKMLEFPAKDGHVEILKWLYSHGYKITNEVSLLAGQSGSIECIDFILLNVPRLNNILIRGAALGGKTEAYQYTKKIKSYNLRILSLQDILKGDSIEILDDAWYIIQKRFNVSKILKHASIQMLSHIIDKY